jgi:hypothetical protein
MDLVTSPTAISPSPNTKSHNEKEEQAKLLPSHGISLQTGSHPAAHRPVAVKHVYGIPSLMN